MYEGCSPFNAVCMLNLQPLTVIMTGALNATESNNITGGDGYVLCHRVVFSIQH